MAEELVQINLHPPAFFDDVGRNEWLRIVSAFNDEGRLTQLNITALQAYCVAYSRWVKAEGELQKYGEIVKAPGSDTPKINPYLEVSKLAEYQMRKLMNDLGMFGEKPKGRTLNPDGDLSSMFESLAESDTK